MVQGSELSDKDKKEPGIFSIQSPIQSTPKAPAYTAEGILKRVMPEKQHDRLNIKEDPASAPIDKPA